MKAETVQKSRGKGRSGGGKRKNRDGRKTLRCAVASGEAQPRRRQKWTAQGWERVSV